MPQVVQTAEGLPRISDAAWWCDLPGFIHRGSAPARHWYSPAEMSSPGNAGPGTTANSAANQLVAFPFMFGGKDAVLGGFAVNVTANGAAGEQAVAGIYDSEERSTEDDGIFQYPGDLLGQSAAFDLEANGVKTDLTLAVELQSHRWYWAALHLNNATTLRAKGADASGLSFGLTAGTLALVRHLALTGVTYSATMRAKFPRDEAGVTSAWAGGPVPLPFMWFSS